MAPTVSPQSPAAAARVAEGRNYLRRWMRNDVRIPADVEIVTSDGRVFTRGTAVIRDVSLKGARLGRLRLRKPFLPIRPFRIRLAFRTPRYRGIGALCRPVRFGAGPEFELGVEFEDFWAGAEAGARRP
jgi:hypothetical protein